MAGGPHGAPVFITHSLRMPVCGRSLPVVTLSPFQMWISSFIPQWLWMWGAMRLNNALRRQAYQRLRVRHSSQTSRMRKSSTAAATVVPSGRPRIDSTSSARHRRHSGRSRVVHESLSTGSIKDVKL